MWAFAGYIDVQWTGWAYGLRAGLPPRIAEATPFSLDTTELKSEIRAICSRAGWTFRPKIWFFQVRRRADGTLPRGLIPSVTRFSSERQFWATLYAVLYVLTIVYIAVASGGWAELGVARRCSRCWDSARSGGAFPARSSGSFISPVPRHQANAERGMHDD
jgi:hypothetical protein